jgi:hypothetical protein
MTYRIQNGGRKTRTNYDIEFKTDPMSLKLANGTYARFKQRNYRELSGVGELLLCREYNKYGNLYPVKEADGMDFGEYGKQLIELPNLFEVIYILDGHAVWSAKKVEKVAG